MIGHIEKTPTTKRSLPFPGFRRLLARRATGLIVAIALTVGPPLLLPKPSQRGVWLEASILPFAADPASLRSSRTHRER